jgi:hypothetical protein
MSKLTKTPDADLIGHDYISLFGPTMQKSIFWLFQWPCTQDTCIFIVFSDLKARTFSASDEVAVIVVVVVVFMLIVVV